MQRSLYTTKLLPLREAVRDLYKFFSLQVAQFPKAYKLTTGAHIGNAIIDLMESISRAAKIDKRGTALRDADIALDTVRDLVWIAHEVRCISPGQLNIWAEKLTLLGNMLGGWIKRESSPKAES